MYFSIDDALINVQTANSIATDAPLYQTCKLCVATITKTIPLLFSLEDMVCVFMKCLLTGWYYCRVTVVVIYIKKNRMH